MTPYALYLHIPFCRQRCSYCDFNTYTTLSDLQPAYVAALAAEIRQVGELSAAAEDPRPGGAYRLFRRRHAVAAVRWRRCGYLLTAAREAFAVDAAAEITMEANPGTVDGRLAGGRSRRGRQTGLSFGVQSALPGELALLGREHDFAAAGEAVAMPPRAAGFDNLNLDLIYGLPGQSVADWAAARWRPCWPWPLPRRQ
jgi:oxygen-independent coproporphyrinogen-3 oxidase